MRGLHYDDLPCLKQGRYLGHRDGFEVLTQIGQHPFQ